jgi:hypothetical protein
VSDAPACICVSVLLSYSQAQEPRLPSSRNSQSHGLLLVGVYFIGSVEGELREMSNILTHYHRSLLQILELLLDLDYTLGYVMRSEDYLELIPVDAVRFFMSIYICIPLISYRAHKLVRG